MKKIPIKKIFVDMDDCIYNLSKIVIDIYNYEKNDNFNYKTNTKWNWLDATKATEQYIQSLLKRKGTFINGEAIEDSIFYINKLKELNYEIYFLTAPMWTNYCVAEKVQWLSEQFSWFEPNKHFVGTANKKLLDNEDSILIDDNVKNLNWTKGKTLCFHNPLNKDYTGLTANTWKEVYYFVNNSN